MLSNPNLDAADTGVDPKSGRYLSNRERIIIFKRRKIDSKKIFGRKSNFAKFGAIMKVPKPRGVEERVMDIEKSFIIISDNFKKLQEFVVSNELLNRKFAIQDERLKLRGEERAKFDKQEEENEKNTKKLINVPLESVAKKSQGFLNSLLKAFGFLFGGWLSDKAFKFFDALKKGDQGSIDELKGKIIDSSVKVLGIFLFMNAFIAKLPAIIAGAASSVATLGALIGKFLLTPFGLKALAAVGLGVGATYLVKEGIRVVGNEMKGLKIADEDTQSAFRMAYFEAEQKLLAAGLQIPTNPNAKEAVLLNEDGSVRTGADSSKSGAFKSIDNRELTTSSTDLQGNLYATEGQLNAFNEYKANIEAIKQIEQSMLPTLKKKNASDFEKRAVQVEGVENLIDSGFLKTQDVDMQNNFTNGMIKLKDFDFDSLDIKKQMENASMMLNSGQNTEGGSNNTIIINGSGNGTSGNADNIKQKISGSRNVSSFDFSNYEVSSSRFNFGL